MKIQFQLVLTGILPADYQNKLCGAFYKAIAKVQGYEQYHDEKSLHSISQVYGTKRLQSGYFITNPEGNGILLWTISSPLDDLILNAAKNLVEANQLMDGLRITGFDIIPLNVTADKMKFLVQSPVILKQTIDKERHYYVVEDGEPEKTKKIVGKAKNWYIHRDNEKCSEIMAGIIRSCAEKVGFTPDPDFKVSFDESYKNKKVVEVKIKKDKITKNFIRSIASTCPVILKGNPETIKFIYNLGIGHSTGMGFGTL